MEQKTEFVIDMLTSESVSVLRKPYYEINGKKFYDENIRNTYMNDSEGRQQIREILPDEYYNAIKLIWNFSDAFLDASFVVE